MNTDSPCPSCGVEAGKPCLTSNGKVLKKPHAKRETGPEESVGATVPRRRRR